MTLHEAGLLLGVHPNTVKSWLMRGWIKSLAIDDVNEFKRGLRCP